MLQPAPTYRGSPKHKNRPGFGRKGTLCPEWAHAVAGSAFNGDCTSHPWHATIAHRLFEQAQTATSTRRYATARGIAFEAKPTGDGTWHGYPVPWESVPPAILRQWLLEARITRRDIRTHWRRSATDLHWALGTDQA
jgi:hypothetical protein